MIPLLLLLFSPTAICTQDATKNSKRKFEYKKLCERVNFAKAQRQCEVQGPDWHLVSIFSEEENEVVRKLCGAQSYGCWLNGIEANGIETTNALDVNTKWRWSTKIEASSDSSFLEFNNFEKASAEQTQYEFQNTQLIGELHVVIEWLGTWHVRSDDESEVEDIALGEEKWRSYPMCQREVSSSRTVDGEVVGDDEDPKVSTYYSGSFFCLKYLCGVDLLI